MKNTPESDTTSEGIRIHAVAQYLPQESDPAGRNFVFRYRITMTNTGTNAAKLLSRHWIIVDSDGRREDLRGRGVVGETPRLGAGETYSYVSYCPIKTTWGTMEGSYTFERDDGSCFQVAIGRFFLVPNARPIELESQSH